MAGSGAHRALRTERYAQSVTLRALRTESTSKQQQHLGSGNDVIRPVSHKDRRTGRAPNSPSDTSEHSSYKTLERYIMARTKRCLCWVFSPQPEEAAVAHGTGLHSRDRPGDRPGIGGIQAGDSRQLSRAAARVRRREGWVCTCHRPRGSPCPWVPNSSSRAPGPVLSRYSLSTVRQSGSWSGGAVRAARSSALELRTAFLLAVSAFTRDYRVDRHMCSVRGTRRRPHNRGLWRRSHRRSADQKVLKKGLYNYREPAEMNEDPQDNLAKVKKVAVQVLRVVGAISSAAAVVNPIFGVVGSLIGIVTDHIDDEDMRKLKNQFASVNRALDDISKQIDGTLLQINKETVDSQYSTVEENLRHQYKKFMEMVEARPDLRERKMEEFKTSYKFGKFDQSLFTLYDGVMGKPKLFGRPILDVYLKHSNFNRGIMEELCKRLAYLFYMGIMARIGYAGLVGQNEKRLIEKWAKQMDQVHKKMQEALMRCS
ncbi:hypothetical protein WMY93_026209 [Mugilogobius chulae]|uniref:Rapunzel 2 n=1 Tax=Mugilogobius chulae TaxID=88201 RepID=A0AAW0N6T9_9GOBI